MVRSVKGRKAKEENMENGKADVQLKTEDTEKKEEDESSQKTDVTKEIPNKRGASKRGKQSGGNIKKKTKSSGMESEKKDEDYEVQKIVDFKEENDKREFLIRWKGYKAKDDTWEPEANLSCEKLIEEYLEKNKIPNKREASKRGKQSGGNIKKQTKSSSKESEKKDEDYEVQKIVDFKEENDKREFLIRWKGYKAKDDTWEPEANLSCEKLIKEYLENIKEPAKLTKIGRAVKSRKQVA